MASLWSSLITASSSYAACSELVDHLPALPNNQVGSCSGLFHLCFLSLWHFYLSDHMTTPSLLVSLYSNVFDEAHLDSPPLKQPQADTHSPNSLY